ncbi:dTDP-4-amino-4,6-dideoxygalactose transaminase [Dethiosulfatibacter aminovorans DSM 17477]|uniref:dTDP-4-amino-4,6-dideoxygalactose transaminase n=1 Tax=Dethiosulfatibacter aminovorans DSM 17477 TaxID=1121476 RepID=A0A1M6M658_9FIRM|nr:dTDP-4-amino-4,6-dideoxygalactose transaminase [Dethiosulfatibacter aminovorans]SHJ78946.1 dTDP-4-amino-4,6-dideoxygalactose transaminase [Dethiosulfatibacter aminovorans DSM 17477]
MKIPFNRPLSLGNEIEYMKKAVDNGKLSGDGEFTMECNLMLERMSGAKKALLTTSCTHALEMAALLLDIKEGDEVIAPSFSFVSTVNAFVLRGARIVFVDIRPDTMNIDENLIEGAITERTKAIVPVHYGGVACEMDRIMDIAERHGISVVEDAAQGIMAAYRGRALGSIGHLGAYSFHDTKNYTMGEGGALLVNDKGYIDRAEIIREKGTNRKEFLRGTVDKYTWVDIGSSYLPSELNAAHLLPQLMDAKKVNENRLQTWSRYHEGLKDLEKEGLMELPLVPGHCSHNAHLFYIKCKNMEERTRLMDFLKDRGIASVFHYIPLHSSVAGMRYGRFHGRDTHTTRESERLLRLPMYYGMTKEENEKVIGEVCRFYG